MSQAGRYLPSNFPGGFVQTLTGNTGGAVPPTAGNINILGSGVVSIAGNPGTSTLTVSVSGAVSDSFVTDSGTATPVAGVLNVNGAVGGNISTTGSGNTVKIAVSGTTQHSLLLGNATGSINSLGVATNGQLPIGSAGADPVLSTLTAGTGINITNGAGSITIAATGTMNLTYTAVSTSPYVVLSTDEYLGVISSGGAITIQLPNAPATGRVFTIKDTAGSSGTHNITVTTVGGVVNIDGATTFVMNTNYESVNVIFNGSAYEIW